MNNETNDAFEALESYAEIIAVMTGVRNQFIEAGWSWPHAEIAALELFRKTYRVDDER